MSDISDFPHIHIAQSSSATSSSLLNKCVPARSNARARRRSSEAGKPLAPSSSRVCDSGTGPQYPPLPQAQAGALPLMLGESHVLFLSRAGRQYHHTRSLHLPLVAAVLARFWHAPRPLPSHVCPRTCISCARPHRSTDARHTLTSAHSHRPSSSFGRRLGLPGLHGRWRRQRAMQACHCQAAPDRCRTSPRQTRQALSSPAHQQKAPCSSTRLRRRRGARCPSCLTGPIRA